MTAPVLNRAWSQTVWVQPSPFRLLLPMSLIGLSAYLLIGFTMACMVMALTYAVLRCYPDAFAGEGRVQQAGRVPAGGLVRQGGRARLNGLMRQGERLSQPLARGVRLRADGRWQYYASPQAAPVPCRPLRLRYALLWCRIEVVDAEGYRHALVVWLHRLSPEQRRRFNALCVHGVREVA